MCTKLQSAQIDKAKIGREVKGIPKTWTMRSYIDSMDDDDDGKEFLKRIMLDRHPYFFRHLYPDTNRKYKKYVEEYDLTSRHKFSVGIYDLINKNTKTKEEKEYVDMFKKYSPVIDSDSVMNNICKHIESVDFDIRNKIKMTETEDIHLLLMKNAEILNMDTYNLINKTYKEFKKELSNYISTRNKSKKNKYDESESHSVSGMYEKFKKKMDGCCSNSHELVDCLIHIFYVENPSSNKDLLWNTYGEIIFENVKDKNNNPILFPFPSDDGEIEYLHDRFELKEVSL